MTAIIKREYQGVEIAQRCQDNYLNATQMCKAGGKLWANYSQLKSTQEYVQALSSDIGIPISLLVQIRKGVRKGTSPHDQGVWVHPLIAVDLAQWIDMQFRIQVSKWTLELATTGTVSLPVSQPVPKEPDYTEVDTRLLGWSQRFDFGSLMKHLQYINFHCPESWSILTACQSDFRMMELEIVYHLVEASPSDRPDGSCAHYWCEKRKKDGRPKINRFAPLFLPGLKFPVQVNLYPGEEYTPFRIWFAKEYIPKLAPRYLADKYARAGHDRLVGYSIADKSSERICGRPALLDNRVREKSQLAGGGDRVKAQVLLPGCGPYAERY